MVGREAFQLTPQLVIEGVVGGAHISPAGLTARLGHHLSTEDRALGLHRHVGTVTMPAHVALEHLHEIAVVVDEGPVALDVADGRHLELKLSKAFGERNLLVALEMLIRKDEERVLQPGGVEILPGGVIKAGKLYAGKYRPEGGVDRL